MAVYKRGKVWWYKFNWRGDQIRESTKHSNKRVAEQIEAAHKTALAKGEVNIRDRSKVPTLREFSTDFEKAIETQVRGEAANDRVLRQPHTLIARLRTGGPRPEHH